MLWPLAIYFVIMLPLVVMLFGLSAVLGQRHHERAMGPQYESGVVSMGSARLRFGVGFHLSPTS